MDTIKTLFQTKVGLKKSASSEKESWNIYGIASSENIDEEGDRILRSALDISYLQKKGYINWNHSAQPSDQLGYTTRSEIIEPKQIPEYQKMLGIDISPHSSLYIEGALYRESRKADEVRNILKSVPKDASIDNSLGLSIEGAILRHESKKPKVLIRGLAITPHPVHTDTVCRLVKSLTEEISVKVNQLTKQDALLFILQKYPKITFDLATRILNYATGVTNARTS